MCLDAFLGNWRHCVSHDLMDLRSKKKCECEAEEQQIGWGCPAGEGSCYAGTARVVPECADLMSTHRKSMASRLGRNEMTIPV